MSAPVVGRDIKPCGACGCYVWIAIGCRHLRRKRTRSEVKPQASWNFPADMTRDEKKRIRSRDYMRRMRESKPKPRLPFLADPELEHMRPWPSLERITARQAHERMKAGIHCGVCQAGNRKLMTVAPGYYICMACKKAELNK